MYSLNIPAKLVNICGITFKKEGHKSDTFITTQGFRQGNRLLCDKYLQILRNADDLDHKRS